MESEKKKTYDPTIDLLRVIAILAVVAIHTSTKTLTNVDLHLPYTLLLNQAARFAVPMFFLISGFLLELNQKHKNSYWEYFKKRANRIIIPYIFWSVIYYFLVYKKSGLNFFHVLLTGDASYQLYFIPSLIIFYLLFPLFHKYYRFIANPFILGFLTLLQFGILYMQYYVYHIKFFHPLAIALLNYDAFLLGIVASHHQEKIMQVIKKWKIEITLATLILLFFVYFEGTIFAQWRPSVFLYTMLLTAILYYFFHTRIKQGKWILLLSKLSFFVFFIHIIFLELLWNGFLKNILERTNGAAAQQGWFDVVFFLSVTLLSFISAYIVHKIPYVSKVTG